jgi:hypothetical protein
LARAAWARCIERAIPLHYRCNLGAAWILPVSGAAHGVTEPAKKLFALFDEGRSFLFKMSCSCGTFWPPNTRPETVPAFPGIKQNKNLG